MSLGIFAEKVGMSQLFCDNGTRKPVTLLKVKDCTIIDYRTKEKDGYEAVVVAFDEVKEKKLSNPQATYFKKKEIPFFKSIREFRTNQSLELGSKLLMADIFSNIGYVDVTSVSKGKGFAGVMKRHNFRGLRASHGVSISHRSHGSTGNMRKQGKVFKGKKMAGHMGDSRVTMQNLKVIKVDTNNNLFIVEGAVPGYIGCLTRIIPSVKKIKVKN